MDHRTKLYKKVKELEKHHNTLPIAHEYFWTDGRYNSLNDMGIQSDDRAYRLKEHNNVVKFDELEWTLIYIDRVKDNYPLQREARAYVQFDNGFYVSILSSKHSYGNIDQYELGILDDNGLCYDTPLTNDVVGYLDKEDVEKWLKDVSELDYDNRTGSGFLGLDEGDEDYEILKDYEAYDHKDITNPTRKRIKP